MAAKTPLFHRGHYNILAAQFKAQLKKHNVNRAASDARRSMYARNAILDLALALAKRLQEDNELFDAPRFLDACSPDPIEYPISELWED